VRKLTKKDDYREGGFEGIAEIYQIGNAYLRGQKRGSLKSIMLIKTKRIGGEGAWQGGDISQEGNSKVPPNCGKKKRLLGKDERNDPRAY